MTNMKHFFAVLLTFFASICHVSSHGDDGYYHDWNGNIGLDKADWMATLSDSARLNEISIPGTHNTMAYDRDGPSVDCQVISLWNQLNGGIRALDIRLKVSDGELKLFHGPFDVSATFDDVMSTIKSFLDAHPTEFIVMRVKNEGDDDPLELKTKFDTFFDTSYSDYFYKTSSSSYIPRICEIRKKVIIFQNFNGYGDIYGLNWSDGNTFSTQDDFKLDTNWDLYDKWEKVKDHINEASDGEKIFINFLSGSVGSFPYFVASGHVSACTDCSRLSTGRTTGIFGNSWPDFPRVNCAFNPFIWDTDCTIAFEGTNILTKNYLNGIESSDYIGILFSDFPGSGLVNSIISKNRFTFPTQFQWSSTGDISGQHCVKWLEPSDTASTSNDNYLCMNQDIGIEFSNTRDIPDKTCVSVNEATEASETSWGDNYICSHANIEFFWLPASEHPDKCCIQMEGDSKNFLCYEY